MYTLKKKYLKYLVLGFLLVITFYGTYFIHTHYRYPYHQDEWQHLGIVINAIDSGFNSQYNPYLGIEKPHADLEPGFHLFLSSFFLLTKIDPILFYQYFAALFAVFSACSIFLCIYKLFKNFFCGCIAILIFSFLPTNVNILGIDYFFPLTMSIPFMFLFINYFLEFIEYHDMLKLSISLILLTLIFVIHPPSFMILVIPASIELLFHMNLFKTNEKYLKLKFLVLILVVAFFSIFFVWKGTVSETLNYLRDILIFKQGWGKLDVTYFLPLLYGAFNTLLGIIGFLIGYKNKKYRFFIIITLFSLGIAAFFNIFYFTLFVPYQRAVYYVMLSMIPFSVLGFEFIISKILNGLNIKDKRSIYVSYFIFTLFLICSFFLFKYNLDLKYKTYSETVISDKDYLTLIWIRDNIGTNNTFVTPYFMTSAVYPISKNKVISLIPAQMEGGPIEDNLNFYIYSCDKQMEIITNTNASFVLSRTPQTCQHFKEIYSNEDFVYKVI